MAIRKTPIPDRTGQVGNRFVILQRMDGHSKSEPAGYNMAVAKDVLVTGYDVIRAFVMTTVIEQDRQLLLALDTACRDEPDGGATSGAVAWVLYPGEYGWEQSIGSRLRWMRDLDGLVGSRKRYGQTLWHLTAKGSHTWHNRHEQPG